MVSFFTLKAPNQPGYTTVPAAGELGGLCGMPAVLTAGLLSLFIISHLFQLQHPLQLLQHPRERERSVLLAYCGGRGGGSRRGRGGAICMAVVWVGVGVHCLRLQRACVVLAA